MAAPLKPDRCIYMDEHGAVFSVSGFLALSGLPDDAQLRAVIIEEIREIFPGIRILEEIN
jgi:hypothetical protein